VDIAATSIERLRARHPSATFVLADVSDAPVVWRFEIVNAFDVLYHITDDTRWERAVRHLAAAVEPRGTLLLTDTFSSVPGNASHNTVRPLARYRALLEGAGLAIGPIYPTHVLLNRELGPVRFMNRAPWVLYGVDRVLVARGLGVRDSRVSKLLVATRRG
jgi:hypothetical protein